MSIRPHSRGRESFALFYNEFKIFKCHQQITLKHEWKQYPTVFNAERLTKINMTSVPLSPFEKNLASVR